MTLNSLDLGGGSGNSFAFDTIGASVTGKVVALEEVQQSDMDSGEPAVWPNGQPKMMYRVELQTTLRDDSFDDGKRSIYLRGSRKPESESSLAAVLAAVKQASGSNSLAVGGTLTVTYTADGEVTRRGFNPPKKYTASYVAPSVNLGDPQSDQPAPARSDAWAVNDKPAATSSPAAVPDPEALKAAFANLTPEQRAQLVG